MEKRRSVKEQKYTNKGITLIALVITIVVLIIIAGVTIGSLTSDKGIIKEARTAKELAEKASLEEQVEMAIIKAEQKHRDPGIDDVIAELKNEEIISNEDQVDKETGAIRTDLGYEITGKLDDYIGKVSTGDGSDNTTGGNNTTGDGSTGDGSGSITPPTTADTTPFVPEGAQKVEGNLDTGFIMTDSNGNEWVWIEVPKSIYTNTEYNEGTAPENSEDYLKIEAVMKKYVGDTYGPIQYDSDGFYSAAQHGFASSIDYTKWKNSMLKSVYEHGGFYIGKYEAGTETARYNESNVLTDVVIKRDMYPYNFVTPSQAQEKSKELATGGKTSSLMFGIQRGLVSKYIEVKAGKTEAEMKADGNTWGNFADANFLLTRGRCTINPSAQNSWEDAKGATKTGGTSILLTTGASDRNSVLGIYDYGGNVEEWTLERHYISGVKTYCVAQGGIYSGWTNTTVASVRSQVIFRNAYETTRSSASIGFRPALW